MINYLRSTFANSSFFYAVLAFMVLVFTYTLIPADVSCAISLSDWEDRWVSEGGCSNALSNGGGGTSGSDDDNSNNSGCWTFGTCPCEYYGNCPVVIEIPPPEPPPTCEQLGTCPPIISDPCWAFGTCPQPPNVCIGNCDGRPQPPGPGGGGPTQPPVYYDPVGDCQRSGGSWSGSSCYYPPPPPSVSISANPNRIIYGGNSVISWSVSRANSCLGTGDWSGSKSASGGSELRTDIRSTLGYSPYRISCSGEGGSASASTNVVIEYGVGATLTVDREVVRPGDTVTLTYDIGTSLAHTCTLKKGSIVILDNLQQTGTYRDLLQRGEIDYLLDCPGNPASAKVKVLPEFQET